MKRRDFISALACSAAGAAILGNFSCKPGLPCSTALVATPEARKAYLLAMLRAFCTDAGPHPVGSREYEDVAMKISKEMQLALPNVSFDRFGVNQWKINGQAEFLCGDRPLETYWGFGSPGTPAEGISGVLTIVDAEKQQYGITALGKKEILAQVTVSKFGRAVPGFDYTGQSGGIPRLNIGKQDVPLLEEAVRKKTPVRAKAAVTFDPNATSCNIVGTLPGKTSEEILFLAHADSQYNTVGANDNMASMITMLMLAHACSGKTPKRTLTFAATGGEEYGLLGAEHYAKTRESEGTIKNIRFCVNFDSLTYGPNLQVYSRDTELKGFIAEINKRPGMIGEPKFFDEDGNLDEKFFRQAGARTLYLNSRGYNEETLPLWHRPEDKPETIHPELVENAFLVCKAYIDRLQQI